MIKSFRDKETQRLFCGRRSRAVSEQAVDKARRKLKILNQVGSIEELRKVPSSRLHKLGGRRKEQWAMDIDDQYRICFVWTNDNNAELVQITDYH